MKRFSQFFFFLPIFAPLSGLGSANIDITDNKIFSTDWEGVQRSESDSYLREREKNREIHFFLKNEIFFFYCIGSAPGECKMEIQTSPFA